MVLGATFMPYNSYFYYIKFNFYRFLFHNMTSNWSTGNLDELHNSINTIIQKITKQVTFFQTVCKFYVINCDEL
jgi:hypothetical protein